ncbi:MAG: AMP-binding protein [Planctomycetes bacterium]|nr:AMP-binding protein [Planctomycetota bacterium]
MNDERALIETAQALAAELHPGRQADLTLDSTLERDLGIDSLGRVELLTRLEHRFGVSLPDRAMAEAETLRDLLSALHGNRRDRSGAAVRRAAPSLGPIHESPVGAATLLEALEWHVARHAERPHITLYREDDRIETITYADLWRESGAVAGGLRERGVRPSQPVALMMTTCREYFAAFMGILRAGGIPVPLYPPQRLSAIEDHVRRMVGILSNAHAEILVTVEEARRIGLLAKPLLANLKTVVSVPDLAAGNAGPPRVDVKADDTAFLQYTSGSTGDPKGVMLTHANLLANIRAMTEVARVDSSDVFVSWLPLYHDMGLIGAWLGSLYHAMRAVLMSPLLFLARPSRWLRALSAEEGTLSAAPNFAYELCVSRVDEKELEGLDLHRWRLAFNGAESTHAETLERFTRRFRKYGFRPEAMTPVYGLAECSLGLTFPPPGRGPRFDRVRRDRLDRDGQAEPADAGEPRARAFVSCGRPLPGHEVRIVDESGFEVGERRQGILRFRGPSATAGYYRNPSATRKLFYGEWLSSGDTAYMAEGEIYITGREKDLIIKAGRNFPPEELEQAVAKIPGIRKGCVAVFGTADPAAGTERLVVVAETRESGEERRGELWRAVHEAAVELLGVAADDVVLAPPHTIPKTPSGKLRRQSCRQLYERGELQRGRRAVPIQILRLALAGFKPTLRRMTRLTSSYLYAGWVWQCFFVVGFLFWMAVSVLPDLRRRRRVARWAAGALLKAMRLRISMSGLERLPSGPCVVVANHASYLDSVVLTLLFPAAFGYVVKREFERSPVLGRLFRRMGAEFVERFDRDRGIQDFASMAERVRRGDPLVVFPEGGFTREPGLRPFKIGAFAAAAQAGVPVVPVALRGTRSILRGDDWFPRPGVVRVTVTPPLGPEGEDWRAALRLRDKARARILRACGEPDLAAGETPRADRPLQPIGP